MFPRIAARTSDPSFVAKAVQDWTAAVGGAKTAYIALDVSFQEAPRKAEVVEASAIRGGRINSHGNVLLTPKGREAMVRAVVDRAGSGGDASISDHAEDRRQMGGALPVGKE
jgi:hypothetical protein